MFNINSNHVLNISNGLFFIFNTINMNQQSNIILVKVKIASFNATLNMLLILTTNLVLNLWIKFKSKHYIIPKHSCVKSKPQIYKQLVFIYLFYFI